MVQVKEFVDGSYTGSAEKQANQFLATLRDEQIVEVKYALINRGDNHLDKTGILVIYKTE
ncbi:sporulation protein Cse60 [Effusibacillus consociatus]|uniref:Sporulation protein Cse60 n=1 Tax=Effusibacillus consociatus TaxID=1117041 RepID=A0ABV9Q6B2_9BACL